jgi:hypothetical protein
MTIANPQSFNGYAYVQNDPVNFVDPSGLEWMCVTGDNNERFCFDNTDPNQTVQIYANSGFDDSFFSGHFNQDMRPAAFIFNSDGPQEPVPQPHPSPTPNPPQHSTPQRASNDFWKCLNGWKFSALVGDLTKGSRLHGAAQTTASILEVGAPMSTAGDAVATGYKATQTTLGRPQPYASGLNWAFRRMSTGAVRGGLTQVGNIAGPVLSGIGAFTAGYNASVAAQCGLGIIK